jgi:hypothetical protein
MPISLRVKSHPKDICYLVAGLLTRPNTGLRHCFGLQGTRQSAACLHCA